MLLAVSGSQGLGKSVLIAHAAEQGIRVIERKTSRSILSDWNVSLSQVNNDRQLTLKFQDEILTRKLQDESDAINDTSSWYITERSYADLFTYAVVAVGKDNECSKWLDAYYHRCVEAQSKLSGVMYLTRWGRLNGTIVDDGVRGINQHYGIMVDHTMTLFSTQMCDAAHIPLIFVDDSAVEERLRKLHQLMGQVK